MIPRALTPLLLAGILLVGLAALWTFWPRNVPHVGQSAQLPPAKEVHTVERIIERPKIVYVYPEKTKDELDLPPEVKEDKNKKITATGKLDAQERPYTLSAVLDVETGISSVYARPDPLPIIGPGKGGAVGVGFNSAETVLYARRDLLRIKALHAGVTGSISTSGNTFAGGFVEYRF